MLKRKFHNGRDDGLTPLESLNLSEISSFSDLVEAMGKTAFSGRQLGSAFQVLLEMWRSGDCTVVLTVSGAMTVAKQGRIICDMIDRGMIQVLVATGALIAHGLTEAIGLTHYYAPDDCDVMDPSIMPATGAPEPDGLTWSQLDRLFGRICQECQIIGFDVSELSPVKALNYPQYTVAKLIYRLIGYMHMKQVES